MNNTPLKYTLLSELLRRLEAEGHSLGIDQHLQLQELLSRLPDDWPPERLKTILCPLLANDRQSQKDLYEYFDQALAVARALQETPETRQDLAEAKKESRLRDQVLSIAILLLLLLAGIWYFTRQEIIEARSEHRQPFTLPVGDTLILRADTLLMDAKELHFIKSPDSDTLRNSLARYEILDSLQVRITAIDTVGRDSVTLLLSNAAGNILRWHLLPTLEKQQFITIDATTTRGPSAIFTPKDYPYDHDIYSLAITPPTIGEQRLRQWLPALKILALLLLAALLRAIIRWRAHRRRKLIAELEQRSRPPYVWNIRFPDTAELHPGENFTQVLNRLRQRTTEEAFHLDVPKTIDATIAKGGMVDFQYRQQTRPPEYLLLIDRQVSNNHRAQLFDSLYQAFLQQEVHIHRYFYNGDVRLCYNELHPDGLPLQDLAQRYPGTRLLVVGNGYPLLSPMTGKLQPWTELFKLWKQRALLSPLPTNDWGRRERQLEEIFAVLPASLQGLNFLVEQLDEEDEPDFSNWKNKITDTPAEAIHIDGGLLPTLRQHYPEPLLQWIAACAVYPDLDYELTGHLGQLLSTPEQPLLTVNNLTELTRLPWFTEGRMPRSVRALLLEYLEAENPALLDKVRRFLHGLLQQQPPPPDSVAAADHAMQLALNEWLFTRDKGKKKELEKEIAKWLEAGVEADFTVIKYLDRERSPLDFVVPDAWKKYVHKGGKPALGWGDLRWALPLWVLVAVLFGLFQLPSLECAGEEVIYKENALCLNTPEDHLRYLEFLIRDAIAERDLNLVDSLNASLMEPTVDGSFIMYNTDSLVAFGANTATALFNQGASIHLSNRDSACLYFSRAAALDSLNADWQAAARWCRNENTPIARFDFAAGENCAPFTLVLENNSLNANAYRWDLGDGSTSNEAVPAHTYTSPGDYSIQLIAVGNYGQDTLQKTLRVSACTVPATPLAELSGLVLDAVTSRPIPNAAVRAADANLITNTGLRNVAAVSTTSQGRFSLSTPPNAAQLQMLITAEGYRDTLLRRQIRAELAPIYLQALPATDSPTSKDSVLNTQQTAPVQELGKAMQVPVPTMVPVPGGTFTMGCLDKRDTDCNDNEKPAHEVTVANFNMSKFEVTVAEYLAFADATGGNYPEWLEPGSEYHIETGTDAYYKDKGYSREAGRLPVAGVSWNDAVAYCRWLSQQTGQNYRLPTESEWEYAARGGAKGGGYLYAGSNDIDAVAWYTDNSGGKPHPVGQKQPNELGLFDMSGNVYEWCTDWYGAYSEATQVNPKGAESGVYRVIRGGSWSGGAQFCRASHRLNLGPAFRFFNVGFRLVSSSSF